MSARARHAPDPGPTLIRISPARIHTQVTQTVRYRPLRSLLLLVLLVIVSLFVLLTLSQMAVVQHTMMAQLDTRRPGVAGLGVGNLVGGRAGARTPQRTWKSQFNQFKIEPLLIRNAPSVEVNSALADNRRRASKLAAIIVRNSILVTYSARHANLSSTHREPHSTQPQPQPAHLHPRQSTTPASTTGAQSSPALLNPHARKTNGIVQTPPTASPAHTTHHAHGLSNSSVATRSPPSASRDTASVRSDVVEAPSGAGADGTRASASEGSGIVSASAPAGSTSRPQTKASASAETQRRHFLRKLGCAPEDAGCESDTRRPQRTARAGPAPSLAGSAGTAAPGVPGGSATPAAERQEEYGDRRETEALPTEFGEAEKDFEPLYLREDDERDDLTGAGATTPAPTRKPRPVPRLTEEQLRALPPCPDIPPDLKGHLSIDLEEMEQLGLEEVLSKLDWVLPGGRWSPVHEAKNPCLPRHKVVVVLPYRDRLHHLVILLSWLHPILRRQQLEYTIYVAEQAGNATFNKGAIMNAGFMEAWQRGDANCFVFHDVDLLPEDDRNMYSCPPQPRHLSVGVDTLGYKLPYFLLVGGVLSVRGDHFLRLNGYSNMYWGWGGEDDDMGYRIKQSGLSITRPPTTLARYTMIRHLKRRPLTWKVRGKLVRTSGRRYRLDGLNTLKYSLLAIHRHPLFTHLLLDVGTPPENLVRLDAH
ncbi:uncharacterized protein LOC119598910 [Penaeus monodon]|uniref:uncharacterized protein LOC119598910 n=1 Tax=Penaeus monodon TaxID=6687 RepID=UPI0018A77E05|nr:uncharacterized protein LOC119598910 [Penaeus monodon]